MLIQANDLDYRTLNEIIRAIPTAHNPSAPLPPSASLSPEAQAPNASLPPSTSLPPEASVPSAPLPPSASPSPSAPLSPNAPLPPPTTITGVCGQRFIAAGMSGKNLVIQGIPGNALGAYLDGGRIEVLGNAQDAVGDTMNDGLIIVRGNIGDTAGYAMRGGKLYVRGNAGYRAGIHVKAYKDKIPLIIIGGKTGSFLGEYQAGGVIIVLNLDHPTDKCVGFFPCTGMHGGIVYLRSTCTDVTFPPQVKPRPATAADLDTLRCLLADYARTFSLDLPSILSAPFTVVTPNTDNPYRQMYVPN